MFSSRRYRSVFTFLVAGILPAVVSRADNTQGGITVTELCCEYSVNPLGLESTQPRLSWLLSSSLRDQQQSAYQILVASSEQNLKADRGDKWDSGRVESAQSVNVPYAGKKLLSREICYWKVRVWDKAGKGSSWSEPATFEMGMLSPEDWKGEWIGLESSAPPSVKERKKNYTHPIASPLLRKDWVLDKPIRRARAYFSGLGWSELYINGTKVSEHVLDPAATDYEKRVLYVTHDVTKQLKHGANAIGMMLGNGWYCEPRDLRYGDSPSALLQLHVEFADGTKTSFVSDPTWKAASGPITSNSMWRGEEYDARLEQAGWTEPGFEDGKWAQAVVKKSPGGVLASQTMPAIKVNKRIKPVKLTSPSPGIYVYDLGQHFGGWARLKVKGPAGTRVAIRYSERIVEKTGLADQAIHVSGSETDFYTLKGDLNGEVYEPRFDFHPVRYVQLDGYPGEPTIDDLEGCVVYSSVDLSSEFACSNPLLNQIHKNIGWTQTNGLFGYPLDCLHRELYAPIDPATVTGNLYPRPYMPLFWTKWLTDIKEALLPDGGVPDIAPLYIPYGGGKPDPAWGGNYPLLVWYLYQYYDDRRLLEDHYEGMQRWLRYLQEHDDEEYIVQGHYGDHLVPGDEPGDEQFMSKETPATLIWTGYYYRAALLTSQAAEVLGKTEDARTYARLAEDIKNAFNKKWFNLETNQYSTGSPTANLFPLDLGIVPDGRAQYVANNAAELLLQKYGGHVHSGNTGTTCMIDTLSAYGHGDTMYGVATKTTFPGWGYMVANGATTIWENWGRYKSRSRHGGQESMIMWATLDGFLYNDLAGIKAPDYYAPTIMAPGFKEIEIRPYVLGDLTHASGSQRTVRGRVSSGWEKSEHGLILKATIPVNCKASVSVPKAAFAKFGIEEGGKKVWQDDQFIDGVDGIRAAKDDASHVKFEVGSGTYEFNLKKVE